MKEGWKKFSQQMKDGFQKFGKDTKKFFDDLGDKIKKDTDKVVENMTIQKKLNLANICQRQNSNVPIFVQASSKQILKHLSVPGLFKSLSKQQKGEYEKLWKDLKKTGGIDKLESVDPVILSDLLIKFYKSIEPQLFEQINPKLKDINQDVSKAAEAMKSVNLHYQYSIIYLLSLMKLISEKEKSYDIKTLVGLFQPALSSTINVKDDIIVSTLEFLIKSVDQIEKALEIDCSQLTKQLHDQ